MSRVQCLVLSNNADTVKASLLIVQLHNVVAILTCSCVSLIKNFTNSEMTTTRVSFTENDKLQFMKINCGNAASTCIQRGDAIFVVATLHRIYYQSKRYECTRFDCGYYVRLSERLCYKRKTSVSYTHLDVYKRQEHSKLYIRIQLLLIQLEVTIYTCLLYTSRCV